MGKMKEIDIDAQNTVDAAMKEIDTITPDDAEDKLRQILQSVYTQATFNTAGIVANTQTLTLKRTPIKIRPEIITGIVLILIAALFPVEEQNKIIFGFGVGIMYVHLVKELIGLLARIRNRGTQIN